MNTLEFSQSLVARWNHLTGQRVQWLLAHEWQCAQWLDFGLTLQDLDAVVLHNRRLRNQGEAARAERFDKLVLETDRTYYQLQELRARQRAAQTPHQVQRDRVLAATHRPPADADKPSIPVKTVIRGMLEAIEKAQP